MTWISNILVCCVALVAAGCATVSHDVSFTADDREAYLLVAVDGLSRTQGSHSLRFQRVDLEAGRTTRQGVSAMYGRADSMFGNELVADLGLTMRFAGMRAEPGDYILLARRNTRQGATQYTMADTHEVCYGGGTSVYRIEPGRINVIASVGLGAEDRPAVAAAVEKLLASYPNLTAPVSIVERTGTATFERGRSLGFEVCRGDTLAFTPEGGA